MNRNRYIFLMFSLLLTFFVCTETALGEQRLLSVRAGNPSDLQSVLTPSSAEDGQGSATLRLGAFTVETVGNKVRVVFSLILDHAAVVRALLRDGAVMNLTCTLSVERLRSVLANKTIAEVRRVYHLRHDSLTREFVLTSPQIKPIRQKHFGTLLDSLLNSIVFELPVEESLTSGESYRVRLEISLQHAEVPPWLEKTLFFWSWDVTPPLSFSQDFVY